MIYYYLRLLSSDKRYYSFESLTIQNGPSLTVNALSISIGQTKVNVIQATLDIYGLFICDFDAFLEIVL